MSPWIEILIAFVSAAFAWLFGQLRVSAVISRRLFGPRIGWDVIQNKGSEVRIPLGQPTGAEALYFRLLVSNDKPRVATRVRAYLTDVRRYEASSRTYPPSGIFDSIPLIWAYRTTDPVEIPCGITQYLDLVELTLDSTGAVVDGPSLRVSPLPNLYRNALTNGGKYAIRILIQSDDYILIDDVCVAFEWDGNRANPKITVRPFRSFRRDFA